MNVLTREQVREVDRIAIEELGMSGLVLMENAGRGVVDRLCETSWPERVFIACGKGNNAGDGFVIARQLDLLDIDVCVITVGDVRQLKGDAAVNFELLSQTRVRITDRIDVLPGVQDEDWILDALLGTGAHGQPRPPYDEAILAINAAAGRKLAIDIPSGLDADSGKPADRTVRADHTCTFVAAKPGLLQEEAQPWVGQLHIVSIGVPWKLLHQFAV